MSANPITAMPNQGPFRKPRVVVIDDDNGQVPAPYDYQRVNANQEEIVWGISQREQVHSEV